MKKRHHFERKAKRSKLIPVLLALVAILIVVVAVLIALIPGTEQVDPTQPETLPAQSIQTEEVTVPVTDIPTEPPTGAPTEATEPPETEPQIISYFQEYVDKNPDFVGWIKVDGTKLDYPLMHVPGDNEKYVHRNIEGNYSVQGLPFINGKCSLDPRSDNLIIYGHHMKNGSQFGTLMDYKDETYWKEHPVIHMSTLYKETEYEVLAAFYDRVYYTHENVFKFYQFINAENEEDFNYAVEQFKKKALYDTGVTAEYGDHLITLVTCAYHTDNGRFVVVARAKAETE